MTLAQDLKAWIPCRENKTKCDTTFGTVGHSQEVVIGMGRRGLDPTGHGLEMPRLGAEVKNFNGDMDIG